MIMPLFKSMSSLTYDRIHLHINTSSKSHSEMSRTILIKVFQHNPKENIWQTMPNNNLTIPTIPCRVFAYISSHWIFRIRCLHATHFSLQQAYPSGGNLNIAAGLQCFTTQNCQNVYRKLPNSNSYWNIDMHVNQGYNIIVN